MRRLILYICQSLDGYIARNDHSLDWLPPVDETSYNAFVQEIDVILMGRRTYEIIKSFDTWPYTQNCIVFTRTPDKYSDARVTFTDEDPVHALARLRKQTGRNIWLMGGGELIDRFHRFGLIDEYIIAIVPVTIGDGIPLFVKGDSTVKLRLTAAHEFKEFVELRFVRDQ